MPKKSSQKYVFGETLMLSESAFWASESVEKENKRKKDGFHM